MHIFCFVSFSLTILRSQMHANHTSRFKRTLSNVCTDVGAGCFEPEKNKAPLGLHILLPAQYTIHTRCNLEYQAICLNTGLLQVSRRHLTSSEPQATDRCDTASNSMAAATHRTIGSWLVRCSSWFGKVMDNMPFLSSAPSVLKASDNEGYLHATGHRTPAVIYLVDPNRRVLSTADTPPSSSAAATTQSRACWISSLLMSVSFSLRSGSFHVAWSRQRCCAQR